MLEPRIFPNGARVQEIRFARPTDQLERVTEFYRDGLGLQVIGLFKNHAGYDGVMLGLPDASVHLEFTQHAHGSPCPAPTRDNLLVLYVLGPADLAQFQARLEALGHASVEPENPYWMDKSLTFEDPDGWRVVLFDALQTV